MLRLFAAIDVTDAAAQRLQAVRANIPGADWVKPSMYHVTLQFIGADIPEHRLPEIISSLRTVRSQPFEIAFKGLERFRTPDWAGVVVARTAENPTLVQLHRDVVSALGRVGFAGDDRVYQPHVTLAYLEHDSSDVDDAVARYLDQFAAFETDVLRADRFILYATVEAADGWTFQPQAEFSLEGET